MSQNFTSEQTRFQVAVENSYDIVAFLYEDGTIHFINDSVRRVLGFERQMLVGTNVTNLLTTEDVPKWLEEFAQVLKSGQNKIGPYRFRAADGSWRWIQSTGLILDSDKEASPVEPRTIVINSRDITEELQAVHAVEKTSRDLLTIWESMSDAFLAIDPDWHFTYINAEAELLLQRKREELLGKNIWEEFPEARGTLIEEKYNEAVRKQTSVQFETFYPALSLWVEVRVYPSHAGLAVYFQDITKRKQAQEAEKYLATIITSSDDAISSFDRQGIITSWNHGAEQLYGYSAQEIIGRHFTNLTPSHELPLFLQNIRNGASIRNFETQRRRKDGSLFDVSLSLSPLLDASGQIIGTSVIARNISEQKQAEAARRNSEKLYHALARHFPNGSVYLIDRNGYVILAEGRGLESVGLSTEWVIGKSAREIFEDSTLCEKLEAGHQRALEGGETVFEAELKGRCRLIRLVPLPEENGEINTVLVMTQDITERKQAEDALRRNEARLAQAQSIAHLGYLELDKATDEHFWSDEIYHILGLELGSVKPSFEKILESVHPQDQESVSKAGEELFLHNRPIDIEHRIVRPNGEVRWVQVQANILFDELERVSRFVCTLLDITLRKHAEATQERLATIVESSSDAIISKTLEGFITTWNHGAEQIYGYTSEEAIGQDMRILLPEDLPLEEDTILQKLQRGEHIENFETRRMRQDGHIIEVSISSSPLSDASGAIIGASSIARDITKQKQAEAERERFFMLSLDMLSILDLQRVFRRVNPAFEKTLGYESGELADKQALDYLHPDDRTASEQVLEQLVAGRPVTNYVNRWRCADGTYKSILWAITPHEDLIYAAGHDISAIKATEEELAQSLALLEATLESTADGILVVNEKGQMTHYNQQFIAMWRIPDEIIQSADNARAVAFAKEQLLNPESFKASSHARIEDENSEELDVLYLKDGRIFERLSKTQRLNDRGVGRVLSFRDITQRVRTAQKQTEMNVELEHERRRLDEILTNVPGIVWENTIDPNTLEQRVMYVNDYIQVVLGYTQKEWTQSPDLWLRSLHPLDRQKTLLESAALIRSGQTGILNYRMQTKDGCTIWTESHIAVVRNQQGEPIGLRGVTMDITERKFAEEERDHFFAMSVDILGTFGMDGEFKRMNPAFTQTLGYTEAEIISKPFIQWVHPDDVSATLAIFETLKQGNVVVEFENRYRTKSGDYRWLEWKALPVLEDGLIYAAARDITERKVEEQSLRKANDDLELRVVERTVELEKANDALRTENIERHMTMGILRETAEALQGANEELRANEARLLEGNRVFTSLMRLRASEMADLESALQQIARANSQVLDAERCSVWLYNEDHTALHCLDLYEKTLELHSKGAELSSHDFPAYFEALASGQPIIANDAHTHISTREFSEAYLKPFEIMSMLDTPIMVAGRMAGVLCCERTQVMRAWKVEDQTFASSAAAICALALESFERTRAEEEMRRAREEADAANLAKSEFLSRMSHELRTPLNAILGFGQILDSEQLSPLQQESVGYICKGGRHLLNLINEVLDIARVEAGRIELSVEPVALNEVTAEACALVRPLANERRIVLQEDWESMTNCYVLADQQRFKQVLINLLSNAIKYNKVGGQVIVSVSAVPNDNNVCERVRVSVHDTGYGISEKDMGKLFIPFERLNAANSEIEGTGLGLALSRKLMQAMAGSLEAKSVLGESSTFTLELPLSSNPMETLMNLPIGGSKENFSDAQEQATSEPKYTILVIEDNLSNLRLVEVILSNRPDIKLMSAMQGSVGLDLAKQHEPDLILLDLNLPDMHGKEVLARLQQSASTASIPVVVVSADATQVQMQRMLEAGAKTYLSKPLDVSEFLNAINEVFESKPGFKSGYIP